MYSYHAQVFMPSNFVLIEATRTVINIYNLVCFFKSQLSWPYIHQKVSGLIKPQLTILLKWNFLRISVRHLVDKFYYELVVHRLY